MSICTKRGDDGKTDLLFGRRLSKTAPQVAACGAVDELNAALGVVRAADDSGEVCEWVNTVQQHLVSLMGMLSTHPEDHERYRKAGYSQITDAEIGWLEEMISQLESDNDLQFRGWARPGATGMLTSAYLDVARTICRRAERECCHLNDAAITPCRKFLNRLSDTLWLVARKIDKSGRN